MLDANISHETAEFLESLGCDAKTVAQFNLEEAEDFEIAEKAAKEKMPSLNRKKLESVDKYKISDKMYLETRKY